MYDYHVHTKYSDGLKTPDEVIQEAINRQLPVLAITDHNVILEEFEDLKEKNKQRIHLVNGCELSTIFNLQNGSSIEVHIIALDFDSEKLRPLAERNNFDHCSYYEEIRRKLKDLDIRIPCFAEMKKLYPAHVGNIHIANYLVENGYAADVAEAMGRYLGPHGERKAYTDPLEYASYVSMEEGVRAVIEAGGVPVLAHLYTYDLSEEECSGLAEAFRKAAGDEPAGLEVFYGKYDKSQWDRLRKIADDNDLYYSTGSDYHGRPGQQMMRRLFQEDSFEDRLIHNLLDIPEHFKDKIRWALEYERIYRCAMKISLSNIKHSKIISYIPAAILEVLEEYQDQEYSFPEDFWSRQEDDEEGGFDEMVLDARHDFMAFLRWYDILTFLSQKNRKPFTL